jgi:hypothetical protein
MQSIQSVLTRVSDGKDHPLDASRFDRCGRDYENGFLDGCLSVQGNTKEVCSSAHQSGFEHGISDGKMAGVNWYILQPGKDFAFHTWEFVQGYVNGFW